MSQTEGLMAERRKAAQGGASSARSAGSGSARGTDTAGGDQPAGSEISVADFAVALVDEAEKDAHRGHRWTIANA